MNGGWSQGQLAVAAAGAGLLFLLQIAFSVILASMSALSRVSLHRLAEAGTKLGFLAGMREPTSPHQTAAALARQLCLLGGALLLAAVGRGANWSFPLAAGVLGGILVAVLLLDLAVGRTLALTDPRAVLRHTGFLVRMAHALLLPIVGPLRVLLKRVEDIQVSGEEDDEDQEEEVEAFIEVGEREGILEANEGEMMRSIVDLDETRVREIMTPRTDIVVLQEATSVEQARDAILAAGHSRIPVYRDTIDNVVGVLHVRDLLKEWESGAADRPIAGLLREAMFVPETLSVADLLSEMRVKTHIALVVDEYGGVAGLVTLEDLLEEIVGDIRDEHDAEETLVRQESDGSWTINASAHVEELEELFGVEFEDRDFDTVGGLVVSELGRVPARGEALTVRNLRIEVLEADPRRIRRVRVRPVDPSGEAQAAP